MARITAAPAQGLAKEERKTQTNATTCHPQALPFIELRRLGLL